MVDGTTGGAAEIAVKRRHVQRDGWTEVRDTLLHEMVHQWQAERGHPADHGRSFREKAREVGIVPAARKADGGSRTD
jgi:predicted SprT family Zn-dependent metalloprotease